MTLGIIVGVVTVAIGASPLKRTSVPRLFAAADTNAQIQSVVSAVAAGHGAAAMIVQSLMAETHGLMAASGRGGAAR